MFIQSEGAIIKGKFLREEDAKGAFKEIIKDYLNEVSKGNDFWDSWLNSLIRQGELIEQYPNYQTSKTCQSFYQGWEFFHNTFLRNTKTIGIIMSSINTKTREIEGYYDFDEGTVLQGPSSTSWWQDKKKQWQHKTTVQVSDRYVKETLKKAQLNFWNTKLSEHFKNLLYDVENTTPSQDEVIIAYNFKLLKYDPEKYKGGEEFRRMQALRRDYREYQSRYKYKDLVFHSGDTTQYGRWQEVFFSHMIKRHINQIKAAQDSDYDILKWNNIQWDFGHSVWYEERQHSGLYATALEGYDNYKFTTGGDIIMANAQGELIGNWQLKMGRNTFQGNAVSMNVIIKYLENMRELLDRATKSKGNDALIKEIADSWYDSAQTEGWIMEANQAGEKTLEEMTSPLKSISKNQL